MDLKKMSKEKHDIRIVFIIFSVFFAIFAWKYYPSILSYVLIGVILFLLSLIAFSPLTLHPLFRLWMKVAHTIGRFNTQLLLTLLFIMVFIPTGLVMRLLGKDPMKRKRQSEGTYWETYELEGLKDKSRYEKQF
jgi:hypothetical protein